MRGAGRGGRFGSSDWHDAVLRLNPAAGMRCPRSGLEYRHREIAADISMRLPRSLLPCTLLALALVAAPARADDVQDAAAMLRVGNLDGALARVDQAIAAKPDNAEARFLRGVILNEQKRVPEAELAFVELTQDFPEMPEPYNNLAVISASRGDYDRARVLLETAVRANPGYTTAYENLGDVYAALAAEAFGKAYQLDLKNTGLQAKAEAARKIASIPVRAPTRPPPPPKPATSTRSR
jgi:tetratricopeptide (TPR) repeat protein